MGHVPKLINTLSRLFDNFLSNPTRFEYSKSGQTLAFWVWLFDLNHSPVLMQVLSFETLYICKHTVLYAGWYQVDSLKKLVVSDESSLKSS